MDRFVTGERRFKAIEGAQFPPVDEHLHLWAEFLTGEDALTEAGVAVSRTSQYRVDGLSGNVQTLPPDDVATGPYSITVTICRS